MKNLDLTKKNLAINGGNPIRTKPWLDNFTTGEEEKKAVLRVMDKGYLSLFEGSHTPDAPFAFEGGVEVKKLESEWCNYYNSNYAVSMNSATSCLYAAIGALGIGYGETKIIECYDFFKAIQENKQPSPNFEDGYIISKIADCIIESSEKEEWIKI